jgi:predicted methyltransferase
LEVHTIQAGAREDKVRSAAENASRQEYHEFGAAVRHPVPADVHDLDLITFLFHYHDTTYTSVDRAEINRKMYAALKSGGFLVIADHSARAGDGTSVGKTFHRIEESVLRREVEAVGFKLVAEGDFWRHPEDPRDFSIQPPSGRAMDEFVLKFQKSR